MGGLRHSPSHAEAPDNVHPLLLLRSAEGDGRHVIALPAADAADEAGTAAVGRSCCTGTGGAGGGAGGGARRVRVL